MVVGVRHALCSWESHHPNVCRATKTATKNTRARRARVRLAHDVSRIGRATDWTTDPTNRTMATDQLIMRVHRPVPGPVIAGPV